MKNNDGTREPKEIPRHARILGYALEPAEKLLLLAIDEHCDGNTLTASKERLAAYTGLSKKQVTRLFTGYLPIEGAGEDRTEVARAAWRAGKRMGDAGQYKPGFVDRKILIQRGKGGWKRGENVTSTYELNEAALKECPKVKSYRDLDKARSAVLPGFREPAAPGHPIRLEKTGKLPFSSRRDTMSLPPQSQPEMRPEGRDTMSLPVGTPCPHSRDTMSHDPSSGLDLRSSIDSSVSKQNSKTTTSLDVPAEIQNGLREILPSLDDRAIKQLWLGCKDNAPDCTVEEVLHFAWSKLPALRRNSTQNPAGLLISSVPLCFEGGERSALAHFRQERGRVQDRQAADLQQRAADQRERQEWISEQEEFARQVESLDTLPAQEFKALHAQAEKADWVADCRRKMPAAEIEKLLRRQMVMIRRAGKPP